MSEKLIFQRLTYMLSCTKVHCPGEMLHPPHLLTAKTFKNYLQVISESLYISVFVSQFSPHSNILSYYNVKEEISKYLFLRNHMRHECATGWADKLYCCCMALGNVMLTAEMQTGSFFWRQCIPHLLVKHHHLQAVISQQFNCVIQILSSVKAVF